MPDAIEKLLRDLETNRRLNNSLLTQLSIRHQNSEDLATLFALEKFYNTLTPAMIQDAAKLYLNSANMVKVTLFPEKKSQP